MSRDISGQWVSPWRPDGAIQAAPAERFADDVPKGDVANFSLPRNVICPSTNEKDVVTHRKPEVCYSDHTGDSIAFVSSSTTSESALNSRCRS